MVDGKLAPECVSRWELYSSKLQQQIFAEYNVSIIGGSVSQKSATLVAVMSAGNKIQELIPNSSSASAFRSVFTNGVKFVFDPRCDGCRRGTKDDGTKCGGDFESHGCTAAGGFTSGNTITFASMTGQWNNNLDLMMKNAIHELGHAYNNTLGAISFNGLSRAALIPNSPDTYLDWQQHPAWMNVGGQDIPGELFADTFIAWTLGGWNKNTDITTVNAVTDAQDTMNGFVPYP